MSCLAKTRSVLPKRVPWGKASLDGERLALELLPEGIRQRLRQQP